jgi:hypothetical protein
MGVQKNKRFRKIYKLKKFKFDLIFFKKKKLNISLIVK